MGFVSVLKKYSSIICIISGQIAIVKFSWITCTYSLLSTHHRQTHILNHESSSFFSVVVNTHNIVCASDMVPIGHVYFYHLLLPERRVAKD